MSYSPEVYAKVKNEYERRRQKVSEEQEAHLRYFEEHIPGGREIEEILSKTGLRIMEAISAPDREKALAAVRKENEMLVARRAALLTFNNLPADYCDAHYICPDCFDTGYRDGKVCTCMKELLYRAQAEFSGLGMLLSRQSFENFETAYYPDSARAEGILKFCREYAETCVEKGRNLLFLGGTGLGKTHLSTAIADRVMKNGGSVVYESAPNIFADFQYERFGRGFSDQSASRTEKYFSSDLLIIDDLGSEMINQFTVSALYNLLNTRLVGGKPILINTNLSQKELRDHYESRITSRIFGEFTLILLEGKDIRMQKKFGK